MAIVVETFGVVGVEMVVALGRWVGLVDIGGHFEEKNIHIRPVFEDKSYNKMY